MRILLIAAIIIECAVFAGITIFSKWTKKVFIVVSALTALGCVAIGFLLGDMRTSEAAADPRAQLYMATRLLEDYYDEETLEVLSVVSDETCERYDCRAVRALSYNVNQAHKTAEDYLLSFEGGEFEEIILDASSTGTPVEDADRQRIVKAALDSIAASETERLQWEAEMKVRYMGFYLSQSEQEDVTSLLSQVKLAIMEDRYEDAYHQLVNATGEDDVQNAIIISNMYVENYNRRVITDNDVGYAALWNEATQLQADLNIAALSVPKDKSGKKIESSEEYQNYLLVSAEYDIALAKIYQESVKRAISYLTSIESDGSQFMIGRELQLAKLYFMSNQLEEARTCILNIFTSEMLDDTQWLGRDISVFRSSFISHISDATDEAYGILLDKLMVSLYQSVFEEDNNQPSWDQWNDFNFVISETPQEIPMPMNFGLNNQPWIDTEEFDKGNATFKEFVVSYLRDVFGGLLIRKVDATAFPQIIADLSVTNPEIEINNSTLSLTDTGSTITNYSVESIQTSDLSLSMVLDRSGSMQGSYLSDSKDAIRNCILKIDDDVNLTFVTFDDSAQLECALTDSKYLVMRLVDGVEAGGGTYISAGLSTAIDSLMNSSGNRVIILLSDGYDSSESMAEIDGVITNAIANGIVIYAIGLEGCDEAYMQMIAARTGGQFNMVTNVSELDRTYQDIQKAMVNNYRITYTVDDTEASRSIIMNDKASFSEARKEYSTAADTEYSHIYEGGLQEANYFKQIGGTDFGGEDDE